MYDKIISVENLQKADLIARKGKSNQYGVQKHIENQGQNLKDLHEILSHKKFKTSKYNEFEIVTPNGNSSDEEISGFYRVLDSQLLKSSNKMYDPKDSLNLKHYLVTGGDGYFEVLASSYSVRKLPPE